MTVKDGVATVVNWGSNADILQVDVATGAMTTLIDGTGLGNCDGVDWAGESLVVSSWSPNRVTLFIPDRTFPATWTQEALTTAFEVSSPADLSVNASGDMFAVACSGDNTVFFGMLPEPSNLIQVTLPSAEAAFCGNGLELHSDDAGTWQIQGTDATGKLLGRWEANKSSGTSVHLGKTWGLGQTRRALASDV